MSTSSRTRHTRKRRRQAKMRQRSKGKFRVNHKGRSGRTGNMHAKKLASRRHPKGYAVANTLQDLVVLFAPTGEPYAPD